MILANPTSGPRIVPYGQERQPQDDLPNGRPSFRVTQKFSTTHDGIDFGNFYCGDRLLASIPGQVRNRVDDYGALITEIHHSSGVWVGYGHLSRFARQSGSTVSVGTTIGYVGSSGLNKGGCHVHYSYFNGQRMQDPWPLLAQNQIRARINGNGINVRVNATMGAVYATTRNGVIIRRSDGRNLGSISLLRSAKVPTMGANHGIGPYPTQWTPIYIGGAYRYVARPLTTYG